jgi:hypothetical protein
MMENLLMAYGHPLFLGPKNLHFKGTYPVSLESLSNLSRRRLKTRILKQGNISVNAQESVHPCPFCCAPRGALQGD